MAGFRPTPELANYLKELDLDNDALKKMMKIYQKDIKLGLDEKTEKESSLKCFITGRRERKQDVHEQFLETELQIETGKFLAIDIGGLTFRILFIHLLKKHFDLRAKVYTVPPNLLMATGEQFFDYLAECLFEFTSQNLVHDQNLPLGFTFGWPVEQKGLSIGILKQWTKGFNCSGVVGRNVVEMLEDAIKRKEGLLVHVAAVLNDTTGTLMSCAWKDPDCKIGLIIGTGTNCCYVERTERVKKFIGVSSKPYVIINTESGAFGDGGQIDFMRTQWDHELDAGTVNPGINTCEKMISSLYLGEFVRQVLFAAAKGGIIFKGRVTDRLGTSGAFDTKLVSDIARDVPGQYRKARAILNDLGYPMPWTQDCMDLQYICYMAWQRAGRIVSAQMAVLLNHMGFREVTIGVGGPMYRKHPGFPELMNTTIRELTQPDIKFQVAVSDDGGGLGAALIAATATAASSSNDSAQKRRKKT